MSAECVLPIPPEQRRKCGRCGQVKHGGRDFYPSDRKRCRDCHIAVHLESRARHLEERRAADRERKRAYLADPERRARILARQKELRRARGGSGRKAALLALLRETPE